MWLGFGGISGVLRLLCCSRLSVTWPAPDHTEQRSAAQHRTVQHTKHSAAHRHKGM